MHVACMKGEVEIVKLLIKHVNTSDALLKAKTFKVRLFCAHTGLSKVNLSYNILQESQSVLHIAGKWNQLECLKVVHKKMQESDVPVDKVEENPYLEKDKV